MIVLFVAVGLAPPAVALGSLIWMKAIHRDPAAELLAGSVALGLLAGAFLGGIVGLGLLLLVSVALHGAGR